MTRNVLLVVTGLAVGAFGCTPPDAPCKGADCDATPTDPSSETTDPTDPTDPPTTDTTDPDTTDTAGSSTDTATTTTGVSCDGVFPAEWIRGGPDCGTEPEIQVHQYDEDTYILRQSLCTSFEAPFLYLLFGDDRALLEDTGAGGIAIVDTVRDLIVEHEAETGRAISELLVVNSHGHGDHTAGNDEFAQEPGVVVVGATVDDLTAYFGLSWPDGAAEIDLGGRIVDLWPIPGHQSAHVALYDRDEGLLLTGDSLYPGRLYISDFEAFHDSIGKLVDLTAALPVCHVLGTHIEMTTTPGDDYGFGVTDHPDEHALELTLDHLVELRDALDGMAGNPDYEVHDDFIVYP